MDAYFDPKLLFSVIVFLATVLFVEAIYTYYRDVRGPQARVSKRMQLIQAGATNAEILASLRRETSNASQSLVPAAVRYLETRLTQAGMRVSANRMLTIMLVTTISVGIIFPILGGLTGQIRSFGAVLLIVLFAGAIGVVLPLMYINVQANKRLKLFESLFPVALDIFVRGLRAGYPVTSALELLVSEVQDPVASEFGLVVAEMNYGYTSARRARQPVDTGCRRRTSRCSSSRSPSSPKPAAALPKFSTACQRSSATASRWC